MNRYSGQGSGRSVRSSLQGVVILLLVIVIISSGLVPAVHTAECPQNSSWIPYKDDAGNLVGCFKVPSLTNGQVLNFSWLDASQHCKSLDAELATVDSFEANKYVFDNVASLVNLTAKDAQFWIGLNTLNYEGAFNWISGQGFAYHELNLNSSVDSVSLLGCVAFNKQNETNWSIVNCNQRLPFICEIQIATPPSNQSLQLIQANNTNNCPSGWYQLRHDKCIKLEVNDATLSFEAANTECQDAHGQGGLVDIQSQAENDFLVSIYGRELIQNPKLASLAHEGAWIGLRKQDGPFANFVWKSQEDEKLGYRYWARGQPSSYKPSLCVSMITSNMSASSDQDQVGRWRVHPCEQTNVTRAFFCEAKPRDDQPQPQIWPNCSHHEGYLQLGNDCFKVQKQNLSWEEAENECVHDGGHLVSINDPYEEAFLGMMLAVLNEKQMGDEYWTGLARTSSEGDDQNWAKYVWTDDPDRVSSLRYPMKWGDDEPSTLSLDRPHCVYLKLKTSTNDSSNYEVRFYTERNCTNTKSSICKLSQSKVGPIHPSYHSMHCPTSSNEVAPVWKNLDRHSPVCYYLQRTLQTDFESAQLNCRRMNATLLSIHNEDDLMVLKGAHGSLTALDRAWYWIGLYQGPLGQGRFKWDDGSAVDFFNYDDEVCAEVVSSHEDGKRCIAMNPVDLTWRPLDCSAQLHFICSIPKMNPLPKPDDDGSSSGSNGLRTFAYVVLGLVITLLFGAALYFTLLKFGIITRRPRRSYEGL